MKFVETKLAGAFEIELERREDARGFFARAFCEREHAAHGLETRIAQVNTSYNHARGTLRGMHWQTQPYQEVKIVRCVRGAILDVIVDLRPQSRTYKEWLAVELTEDNRKALYVPKDFAHGYLTLRDESEAIYFVSEFYQPGSERGLRWNDETIGIEWPRDVLIRHMTDKDRSWPDFAG